MDNNVMSGEREILRGEVYWCEFLQGTGSEQIGRRPVVVVSNDKCNEFSQAITVVPLTTATKKRLPTHAICRASNKTSVALAEQIFTVDKDRIGEYINRCTENEMDWIEKCLKIQLGIYDYEAERRKREEENGIKVISRGYRFFRRRCECCGAVYEYTIANTEKGKSETICPECEFANSHSAEFGIECVENDG